MKATRQFMRAAFDFATAEAQLRKYRGLFDTLRGKHAEGEFCIPLHKEEDEMCDDCKTYKLQNDAGRKAIKSLRKSARVRMILNLAKMTKEERINLCS